MPKYNLFFDCENILYGGFARNPTLNQQGIPIGGVSTLLTSIKQICSQYDLGNVVLAWGGSKGVSNKRLIYEGYKKKVYKKTYNREPFVASFDNRKVQIELAKEIVDCLPVSQICLENYEGDNALFFAYRFLKERFPQNKNIIISGDKDFYQLLCEDTFVWSPQKKALYTKKDFTGEFGIENPLNFLYFKALVGDASDNIGGVHGIGSKGFIKHFSFICDSEEFINPGDFWGELETTGYADERETFKKVLAAREEVESYLKIINLNGIDEETKKELDNIMLTEQPFKYNNLLLLAQKNGIGDYLFAPLMGIFGLARRKSYGS